MPIIFLYLLKVNVLALVLYGCYHLFLRDKAILRWNRYYLLSIVPVAAVAPVLNIPLRVLPLPATDALSTAVRNLTVVPGPGEADLGVAQAVGAHAGTIPWGLACTWSYAVIAAIMVGILITQVIRLVHLRRAAEGRRVGGALLLETDVPGTPFSFFRWIFWDRRLDPGSTSGLQVLRHELAHVELGHSLDKLTLQFACALWFPVLPFRLVRNELQLVHEYEADRRASGQDGEAYVDCLVRSTVGPALAGILDAPPFALTQGFRGHSLTRRIAMLGMRGNTHRLRRYLTLPLAFCSAAIFAFRPAPHSAKNTGAHPLIVVIDPGHGGSEPGARIRGIQEKDLDLQLARTLAWLAPEYPSLRVVLTRYKDTTLTLDDRIAIARKTQAGLLISLHINFRTKSVENGAPGPAFSGVEAYVSGSNPQYDSSVVLGSLLLQGIGNVYKVAPHLMQRSVGIRVLGTAPCPAALLECGYMSNPGDLAWISNTGHQQALARSILESLSAYAAGKATHVPVDQFKGTQP